MVCRLILKFKQDFFLSSTPQNIFKYFLFFVRRSPPMSTEKTQGNPAVVGLAGFALTTMLLQIHNIGLCDIGPIVALGLVFGGLAQMLAGFQEFKCGNNFGYSAFVSYGCFWIALGIIFILNHFNIYHSSTTDVGWFLVAWTIYTFIMWIPAMRIHGAMATTFTLLLIGFILLDLAHFGFPELTKVAGYELLLCAASAWYMMAHAIYAQVFGRDVLPVGKPWIK
jgi:succinate-acetate transporter protein